MKKRFLVLLLLVMIAAVLPLAANAEGEPTITAQPEDIEVTEGEKAIFRITAENADSYQWQYQTKSGTEWHNISINKAFQIDTRVSYNGYKWHCIIKNSAGSVESNVVTLTVIPSSAPVITTQPSDVTVTVGETFSFKVVAEHAESYQWQYREDSNNEWKDLSGSTKTGVSITATESYNGYQFRCVITNSLGSVQSEEVTLTVKKKSGTCGDNLTWNLDDNGVLTISGTGKMTDYSTSTLEGTVAPWRSFTVKQVQIQQGVTSIGNSAFYDCAELTGVTIPESVTEIGSQAFRWCTGLTNVTISDGVRYIYNSAFQGCTSLTSVTIPRSVRRVGADAFRDCTALTSATIENGSIGHDAFRNCGKLANLTFGNNVTSIGNEAFAECISLTNVTIPESVTEIGPHAFRWCTGLTSVRIPDSVTTIGSNAFADCGSGLTIRCFQGSKADEYAQANNIDVEYLPVKPVISVQPTDAEEYEGETVTFTITASPVTGYQWYYRAGNGSAWTEVAENGNSARYSFTASADQNGWQFYCQVSNNGSAIESNVVTLSVEQKPVTTGPVLNLELNRNSCDGWQTVVARATITNADGSTTGLTNYSRTHFTFTIKNGNGEVVDYFDAQDGTGLTCDAIYTFGDNNKEWLPVGTYTVTVTATLDGEEKSVTKPFTFTGSFPSADVLNNYSLGLKLNKDEPIVYSPGEWIEMDVTVRNQSNAPVKDIRVNFIIMTKTGQIVPVDSQYAFYYKITDSEGTCERAYLLNTRDDFPLGEYILLVEIDGSEVNVEVPFTFASTTTQPTTSDNPAPSPSPEPTIVTQPKNTTVPVGEKATFQVEAEDATGYDWQYRTSSKDTTWKPINSATTIFTDIKREVSDDKKKATLTFTAEAKQDGYIFRCKPKNAVGSTNSNSATLTVTVPVMEGTCGDQGDNVIWEVDDQGALVISGTGGMADYDASTPPWPEDIKTVTIEKGVTSIGKQAFAETSITSVTIPSTVTSIGEKAFYKCNKLTSVTIDGNGLTSIGNEAFANCSKLTKIVIPASVTSIGEKAFNNCSNLTSVTINGKNTTIGKDAFANCSKNLTIYCYSGSKAETYAKTNKITYKLLDATQTTTTVPPSAPAATPIPNPFIITQPKGMTVAVGDVALFEVVAANAQSYQWEYRVSSTAPWNKITNSTDRAEILFFIAEAGQNGYEFRCQITNTSGSCCTNTAKLIVNGVRPTSGPRTGPKPTKSVGSAVRIKSTPRPTIYATVPPEIEIFYETPAPTATPDPSKPAKTATPKPSSASSGDITIISQPTDAAVNQGDLVTFSVQATGAVEYHWYYRPVGQDEWLLVTENGDSSTLAFYASKAASGYQFCCEIWGRTDIMYSDIVTLFVK